MKVLIEIDTSIIAKGNEDEIIHEARRVASAISVNVSEALMKSGIKGKTGDIAAFLITATSDLLAQTLFASVMCQPEHQEDKEKAVEAITHCVAEVSELIREVCLENLDLYLESKK